MPLTPPNLSGVYALAGRAEYAHGWQVFDKFILKSKVSGGGLLPTLLGRDGIAVGITHLTCSHDPKYLSLGKDARARCLYAGLQFVSLPTIVKIKFKL